MIISTVGGVASYLILCHNQLNRTSQTQMKVRVDRLELLRPSGGDGVLELPKSANLKAGKFS